MKIKNIKILVTGSSCTIGNRLCEKLLERGADITGIDWRKNMWKEEIAEMIIEKTGSKSKIV